MRRLLASVALALLAAAPSPALNDRLTGDIAPIHDPSIAREGDVYYVFGTGLPEDKGGRLSVRTSRDLVTWTKQAPLFPDLPAWAARAIPGASNLWAPDISRGPDGRWRLYYSVSTFGSNRSAIGLATSTTLDPAAPGYGWRDEGMVVASKPGDDYNAIDPNHIDDGKGGAWLALGSFWGGIKLFRLDPATGKLARPGEAPLSIAARPGPAGGPHPIEAPFVVRHGDYFWLIVSYDYCCKGAASTYYTVVGRAKAVTGPYLGKDGSRMTEGGGTILLRADLPEQERFRGPGHAGYLKDRDGAEYLVWHAYDKTKHGTPTLRIGKVRWGSEGWPTIDKGSER